MVFLSPLNKNQAMLHTWCVVQEPADGSLCGSHDVEVTHVILRIIL